MVCDNMRAIVIANKLVQSLSPYNDEAKVPKSQGKVDCFADGLENIY